MTGFVKINLEVAKELDDFVTGLGERSDVYRRAFAMFIVAHQAVRQGKHIGLVDNSSSLDIEYVGIP